jgi:hypothetical protein
VTVRPQKQECRCGVCIYRYIGSVLAIRNSAGDDSRREFNKILKETIKLGMSVMSKTVSLGNPD